MPFTIHPSRIAETPPPGPPSAAVTALALAKARAVASELAAPIDPRVCLARSAGMAGVISGPPLMAVLGADTEVVWEGTLLGKPRDAADAVRMLRQLRGRVHEVVTGVALVEVGGGREATEAVVTRVTMGSYSDEEIEAYVATGEPFDKAGAYAVQGLGGQLVAAVDGCFTNVVGLPITTTRRLLARWGLL